MKELFAGAILSIMQEFGFIHSEEMLNQAKTEIENLFDKLPEMIKKVYVIIPLIIALPFIVRKLVGYIKQRYIEPEQDRVTELISLLKEELTNESK